MSTENPLSPPDEVPSSIAARQVTCPRCAGPSLYSPANPWRPFCSERCQQIDFGAWAAESFRLEADAPPDEAPHGDPRYQA